MTERARTSHDALYFSRMLMPALNDADAELMDLSEWQQGTNLTDDSDDDVVMWSTAGDDTEMAEVKIIEGYDMPIILEDYRTCMSSSTSPSDSSLKKL